MKIRKLLSLVIDIVLITLISLSLIWALLINKMNIIDIASWLTFIVLITIFIVSFIDLIINCRFLFVGKITNSKFLFVSKLIVSSASLVLFLSTICYLQFNNELYNDKNFFFINLIIHYICPILFSISFIFLETDTKHKFIYILYSPLIILLYFAYVIPLVATNVFSDPYGFINFTSSHWFNNVLICLLYVILSFISSLILYSLNHIFYMLYGEGESEGNLKRLDLNKSQIIVDEDKTKEINEKDDNKPLIYSEENKEEVIIESESYDNKDGNEEINKNINRGKIYHITYRSDSALWSVKLEKGKRALKLFKTQAEAINYVKELIKTQDASYRVHSLKGKIRKI